MAPHKNILFLIADDLGKYVGCYDCKSVVTPNLDKLAASGTKFTHAFASTASCSGSRSTVYTGLHTHENGQYGLNIFRHHFVTFEHVETAPKLFNEAGYKTGIIGKVHVGAAETYPWQHRQESDTRDVAWVADQCEAFFHTNKSEPFYLTVGFVDPHRDITTRGGFGNDEKYDPRVSSIDIKASDVEVPSWLSDVPETRQELVEYYKAVHRTDCGVGLILDALERQGLADSTLVVFTSDNGPPFINAKTTLYDAGTCLPLLIRQPGGKPGITNPNMISYIDFLPTFLDFAGIKVKDAGGEESMPGGGFDSGKLKLAAPKRRGRSFLPVSQREDIVPDGEWQHHVFGSHTFHELQNYWPTRVLRTRRYKYHRNIAWRLDFPFASDLYASLSFEGMRNASKQPMIGSRPLKDYIFRPAEELFDLENDSEEVKNLATDPEHQKTLLECRNTLEQWQVSLPCPAPTPPPLSLISPLFLFIASPTCADGDQRPVALPRFGFAPHA